MLLYRKMFRDIKKNLSQFITIFLMITIGIMVYSGIEAYMSGMTETANRFYSENNLQDLNVTGALTTDDLETIKDINNVKDAEAKLSLTATTDQNKTLLLNLIESNNISKFYVYEGENFNAEKSGVWLDNFYAIENDIRVGDEILIKFGGLELHEKVLGLINVPDHLYDVRDESELYPNHQEFGFAYISKKEINAPLPFNSIMVDVNDAANADNVKNAIEDKVKNAKVIIHIEDTTSYVTYQGEIDEGKTYVGVFSGIFLFIALLSVITTMTRVIKKERTQIGTLKALGFSNYKILFHYVNYGLWVSIISAILGLILGYFFIGSVFIGLEMAFFEIPNGHPTMNASSYVVAGLTVIAVVFITYLTGKNILKENPAETLLKETPKIKASSLKITKSKAFSKLNFAAKWNLRDMLRNKARTLMGLAGVVGCAMLIVCALGMLDSMNYFIRLQFETLYHFDYKLDLEEGLSKEELQVLYDKYGDSTSESLGIEIRNDNETREANNIFVTNAGDRIRFVNHSGTIIEKPSDDGIFVTYKLAETKGYKLGDEITWHIYGDDNYYTSKIIGFNKDPQNQNLTMTKSYLESLGLDYTPNSLYTNQDLKDIGEIKNVESIQNIESLKEGMRDMLSTLETMLILIISIAIVLGSVIIYNLGVLSFTEKEYQFATLKVLGFTDKRIKNIFVKQNNWIALLAIFIGCPLGYLLTDWLFKTAIEEHYDFDAFIEPRTYIIAAIGTFIVSYLVSKFLARKIKSIDLVSSLKGNE